MWVFYCVVTCTVLRKKDIVPKSSVESSLIGYAMSCNHSWFSNPPPPPLFFFFFLFILFHFILFFGTMSAFRLGGGIPRKDPPAQHNHGRLHVFVFVFLDAVVVPQPTFQIIPVTFVPCTPFFRWRGKLRNTYLHTPLRTKRLCFGKSSHKVKTECVL